MIPKILAIAPYEGLRELLLAAKHQRNEFSMDVYLGDLQDGVDLAKTLEHEGYDLVLSRGGTARAIRNKISLPVMEIELSAVDILRAIKLAQQSGEQFAIVCFANLFRGIQQILEYLGLENVYFPITSKNEARQRISQLSSNGVRLIVGDAISVMTASELAVSALLIQSGAESVHAALDGAVEFLNRAGEVLHQNTAYQKACKHNHLFLFIYNTQNQLTHNNLGAGQPVIASLSRQLPRYLSELRNLGELSLVRRHRGGLYSIRGWIDDTDNAIITVQQRNISSVGENALELYHVSNGNTSPPHPPLDTIGQMVPIYKSFSAFSKNQRPIALIAEKGTPAEAAVREIYSNSEWKASPLIILHCSRLSAPELIKLLQDESSPLLENNLCFYISRLDDMDNDSQYRFVQFVNNSSFALRNKLIFSLSPGDSLIRSALDQQNSLRINLPPLRERIEDLPGLCSLYLNQIGFETGHLVIGLTADAMLRLQSFSFPGNNTQLYRVLTESLLLTKGDQILPETINNVLALDNTNAQAGTLQPSLLSGTLEQINQKIVELVLQEEGGNRSRTAERLGIGRSTLWRMLGAKDTSS